MAEICKIENLFSALRHGRACLMLNENSVGGGTGFVMVAAECCEAEHITFMARQARGLICLGLTHDRCSELQLPLMVEGDSSLSPFTLSIEAASGIDTGISAADRAQTVRVAVDTESRPSDLVQPGHIFPIAASEGGVLTRTGPAEASIDLANLSGLLPMAVFTEVLNDQGALAEKDFLMDFAKQHNLLIGRVSDLVNFRLANQNTIDLIRQGEIKSRYGQFHLHAYRDLTQDRIHLALSKGEIKAAKPTLVRVHVAAAFRDLVGTSLNGHAFWSFDASLRVIASEEAGVLLLLSNPEAPEDLLNGLDRLLGAADLESSYNSNAYNEIGVGAQILRDLGVGQIRLLGAPLKYSDLAGFGLEVVEFMEPK